MKNHKNVIKYFEEKYKHILFLADPEFLCWWKNQPVDLVEEAKKEFWQALALNSDYFFCRKVAHDTLVKIWKYSGFHLKVKRFLSRLDEVELNNFHWSMRDPHEDPTHKCGRVDLPVYPYSLVLN